MVREYDLRFGRRYLLLNPVRTDVCLRTFAARILRQETNLLVTLSRLYVAVPRGGRAALHDDESVQSREHLRRPYFAANCHPTFSHRIQTIL